MSEKYPFDIHLCSTKTRNMRRLMAKINCDNFEQFQTACKTIKYIPQKVFRGHEKIFPASSTFASWTKHLQPSWWNFYAVLINSKLSCKGSKRRTTLFTIIFVFVMCHENKWLGTEVITPFCTSNLIEFINNRLYWNCHMISVELIRQVSKFSKIFSKIIGYRQDKIGLEAWKLIFTNKIQKNKQ